MKYVCVCATFLSPYFDVIPVQLLNRRTAARNLFVKRITLFYYLQMVTALSIAGDLSFNPETDPLTSPNGEIYIQFAKLLTAKFEL